MSSSLPDIGRVTASQIGGLEIRLARGGRSDGIPILLTSPWPESIYCFRGILPAIKELGPLILAVRGVRQRGGRRHRRGICDSVRCDKDGGGSGGLQAVFRRPEVSRRRRSMFGLTRATSRG